MLMETNMEELYNITSIVDYTGNLGQANYSASKAGIVAMSKSLAIEYAKKYYSKLCFSRVHSIKDDR